MRILGIALALAAAPAFADFNDKKPINATVTGATPSGYPRTMVEGLNAVVRDTYPGSAVSFKPNSPGGGVLAIAEGQADFTATATGTEVKLANDGTAPFSKPLNGKFSYVMQLYDNQFIHFLMTKEWAEQNGIRSWADIAAKKPRMRLAINRPDNPQTTIGGPYEVMVGLPVMQDVAHVFFGNAQTFGGLVDGQALADDEADGRPVDRGFGPCVLGQLHDGFPSWHGASVARLDKPAKIRTRVAARARETAWQMKRLRSSGGRASARERAWSWPA